MLCSRLSSFIGRRRGWSINGFVLVTAYAGWKSGVVEQGCLRIGRGVRLSGASLALGEREFGLRCLSCDFDLDLGNLTRSLGEHSGRRWTMTSM